MVEMYKPAVTYNIGWIKGFLKKKHGIKPRYRIFFYMDGRPKAAVSDDLWCLWSPYYGDNYPHVECDDKETIAKMKERWL